MCKERQTQSKNTGFPRDLPQLHDSKPRLAAGRLWASPSISSTPRSWDQHTQDCLAAVKFTARQLWLAQIFGECTSGEAGSCLEASPEGPSRIQSPG